MKEPTKRAWATINLNALLKNLALVRELCPESGIIPVIKSNAYGHGMEQVARALRDSDTKITSFAVATLDEALELKDFNLDVSILLLNGFVTAEELALCIQNEIEPVIHSIYQVELLEQRFNAEKLAKNCKLWLKHNSGMNRLGMTANTCLETYAKLHKYPGTKFVLMSHLAYADDMNNPNSLKFTTGQMKQFKQAFEGLVATAEEEVPRSMAASAGILTLPSTHFDYVRPGVMLYGSSPLATETGQEIGLQPVMTLSSRLISMNQVSAGESIGYNATFVCDCDTLVGVVSIGYGDGYPRSAVNGTPVLVKTLSGVHKTHLIGRISMDTITIDLTGINDACINDEVILWGDALCADEVAHSTGTIAYELFCKVTKRVTFEYV